jgi:Icc protein
LIGDQVNREFSSFQHLIAYGYKDFHGCSCSLPRIVQRGCDSTKTQICRNCGTGKNRIVTGKVLIAQVTDCHLSADPQKKYRGVNPYKTLKALMRKIRLLKPDLLLASGDLSEDASPASYHSLRDIFVPLDIPVLALPGNHDDPGLLSMTFPPSPVDGLEVSDHGGWQIIRLNSCLPGRHEGLLSRGVMGRPRLIALHHQPMEVGSPWIDKYALLEPEKFLGIIDQYPDVKATVWGHVHQVFDAERNGIAMLGGPSSVINGLAGAIKFTADPSGPGCRWLELAADGSIQTGIIQAGKDQLDSGNNNQRMM